jgi:hypothetical protein
MSLWGNKDSKTVAGSVTVTAANSTVVGVGTTFTNFEVGDSMNVGQNDYVITAIANATVMTVRSGVTGGTLVGAQSNSAYVISEKPLYMAYSQVGGDLGDVYGADVGEMEGSPISTTITITDGGSDYTSAPTIVISAPEHPNGVQATATCTISANAINAVTVTNDGEGYQSVPTVTLVGGNTTIAGVATLTAALVSTEQLAVPHAGWVKRTAGSGGRSGRVHYEVLVASSSITGDAADDTVLPE